MKVQPNRFTATRIAFLFALVAAAFSAAKAQGVAPPCVPGTARDDAVMEWNCRTVKYALSPTFGGALRQIRAMAVVHLSVHNAVNGITGEYETYSRNLANVPPAGASADAAAIGAAYQSLYGIVNSAQRTQLDAELAASLASRGIAANDPSLAYGRNEGQNVVNMRTGDGSGPEAQCAYADNLDPQPGDWVRILNVDTNTTPAAATPCWRFVPPFVLGRADQFPLADPPSLQSGEYVRDLQEVRIFGGQDNTARQDWQSRIADFWDGPPVGITNQAVRQAAAARPMSLSDRARALALVYVVGTDASIACWHYKYTKLFWRPETAINNSVPLPRGRYWKPYLFPSHPHPEYPSGHSTNSGAMFSAAALAFGDEPGITMTPTITRNGVSVTPQWESFSEGINEVIVARIYSGLHFRFTDERSAELGTQIAEYIHANQFRKCSSGIPCAGGSARRDSKRGRPLSRLSTVPPVPWVGLLSGGEENQKAGLFRWPN